MGTHRKIKKAARCWETPLEMHDGTTLWEAHFTESEYRFARLYPRRCGEPSKDGWVAHVLLKHGRDKCKGCMPRVNPKPRRGKGFPR